MVYKPSRIEEIVGDAQVHHVVVVSGKSQRWRGEGRWAAVGQAEKLPLRVEATVSLGILQELQFNMFTPGKNGLRVPTTHSQRRQPWPEANNSTKGLLDARVLVLFLPAL